MNDEATNNAWEQYLTETARAFPYPAMPMLPATASRSAARLHLAPRRVAVLACVALLIALLLAVPGVRAAIRTFLRIGAVRIEVPPEPTVVPAPSLLPVSVTPSAARSTLALSPVVPTPTLTGPTRTLYGATTLADARSRLPEPLLLPNYPSDLGAPGDVYVQNLGGPAVILVWYAPNHPDTIWLSLHILSNNIFVVKSGLRTLQTTTVNGYPAAWAEGPHLLQEGPAGDYKLRRLVNGNTLVWTVGSLTYRLETTAPLPEAVHIAESLR
ncbi:MAG: hypothetical protein NVS2B7_22950 [Herpetosiphon sp.]